jgi:HPt (histidine-containing phosphotransfer) domain-containing protein
MENGKDINWTVVRDLFGGNMALFHSLSARLVREFGECALPAHVEPHDAAAVAEMKGRLHKLRGGAGMIGATRVHHLAEAAEAALATGQAAASVGPLLRDLAAALTALSAELALLAAAGTLDEAAGDSRTVD